MKIKIWWLERSLHRVWIKRTIKQAGIQVPEAERIVQTGDAQEDNQGQRRNEDRAAPRECG